MKHLIDKIIKRIKYNNCYNKHEYLCVAVFGLCCGCNDDECPYHIDINKEVTK